jgi:hypothetical protein
VTQTTDALLLISTEDSFSKSLLMQPALRLDRYVSPPRFQAHGVELHVGAHWHVWRVDSDGKAELLSMVSNDVYRPDGHVATGSDADEVDEGNAPLHRETQPLIVAVHGISATVPISQEAVGPHAVVVGAILSLDNWNGRDAERHLRQDSRREDALRRDERHALPLELEPLREHVTRQHLVPVELGLLPQELKGPRADSAIGVTVSHLA